MIDWDRLTTLHDDIGAEDFADVATLFVAELNETLERLVAEPASAADFHFLRGSAANLGFAGLAELCGQAELACKSGAAPDISRVIDCFHTSLREAATRYPALALP